MIIVLLQQPQRFLVNGATSNCGTPTGASINAGNYQPVQPFTNLIGSTLNGNWTLRVTDNLNIDNGYIFSWGINFDSALIPTDYQFTPVVTSSNWTPDPSITNVSGNQITVTPTSVGTFIVILIMLLTILVVNIANKFVLMLNLELI